MNINNENTNPIPPETREAIRNPIITAGDQERFPLLEMESLPCSFPLSSQDHEALALMEAVLDTLDEEAAGLAAVQIGYPKRIFMLRDSEGKNTTYINPVVLSKSKETKTQPEACLSLPHLIVNVKRPKSITLEYFDAYGSIKTQTFEGFDAKCVSHELDHLAGRLIIHELEKQISKQPRRTNFGMVLTPQRKKVIARRRAKTKRAKRAKRHAKSIGR